MNLDVVIKEARVLIRDNQEAEAIKVLENSLATAADLDSNQLLKLGRLVQTISDRVLKEAGFIEKKVAFFGGYTTSFIRQALHGELFRKRIVLHAFEGDYNSAEEVALFGNPIIDQFKPELFYLCIGFEYRAGQNSSEEVQRWLRCIHAIRSRYGCAVLCNNFEEPIIRLAGSFDARYSPSDLSFVRSFNELLARDMPDDSYIVDVNFLSGSHGRNNWRSPKIFDMAKIPVNHEFLAVYAGEIARVIGAIYGKSKKCLVLDLDNTLWGGVIGDDGLKGILIGEDSGPGEGFKRFQEYCLRLKQRGVILAVCSKNDMENAQSPFVDRTDMVLKLADISCFVANWEPKHINIARIAKTLNIGLDSLVFFDDNPVERDIVRRNLPQVAVVEVPLDPSDYAKALSQSGYFDTVSITADDENRSRQYTANLDRQTLETNFENYEDFLKSLDMKAIIRPFDHENLPRIVQLVNKTNQFNLTTRRYSSSDLELEIDSRGWLTRYVKIRDKFGDNGLISVFSGKIFPNERRLDVDLWLMSCRVLKRGIERFLFADVVKEASNNNISVITGRYYPTEKNQMVENLLCEMGFTHVSTLPSGVASYEFHLSIEKSKERLNCGSLIRTVDENLYI